MPRGNSPPWPDVTRTSPTWIPAPSRAMYLKRSVPRASPSTIPGVRVRTTCAPTVEAGSVRTWMIEAPGRTSTIPPIARDDLPGQRRERQPLLERQQVAQAAVLVLGLAHAERLDAQLLVLVAQPVVLGANVLPVTIGVPHPEGRAVRPGDPCLHRRGHQRQQVAGGGAVAAGLEREEQQTDGQHRGEQRELPNLHRNPPTTERGDALGGDRHLLQQIELVEHFPCAQRDA